jgi:hypothetical protein
MAKREKKHKQTVTDHNLNIGIRSVFTDGTILESRENSFMLKLKSSSTYRSKRGQRGEAEMMLFAVAVGLCILFSGSMWLLGWIRDSKDAKVIANREARLAKLNKGPFVPRSDPAEYLVQCDGSLFTPLNVNYPCRVLPESFGELDILDD